MHLYYTLSWNYGAICAGEVGGFEVGFSDSAEPTVRYHPDRSVVLTSIRNPDEGQWKAGSLTGAVAS